MILITGGSGYVGSHITQRLAGMGKPVRVLVRNPELAKQEGRLADLDVDWCIGDVTQPETLVAAMEDVDTVIHTVAVAIEKSKGQYEAINYQGTVNIVEAAEKAGVKRFVHMGQMGSSPDIQYRFLRSKGLAEKAVTESDLAWTSLKPSVVWGPEDEFANVFAKLVLLTPIIYPIIGDGKAAFQSIWVEDLVSAVVGSMDDAETIGQIYELGGPEVLTIEDIERRSLEAIGKKRLFIPFPIPLLRVIVSVMELVFPNPPVTSSLLDLLSVNNVPEDNQIARFVDDPRPFTAENAAPYMREFTIGETLKQFFTR